MKVIYELQLPHIELATLASRDETRLTLAHLHIDPRGYVQATDGHRLGRLTGVRWWERLGPDGGWMRHPDPVLTEPRNKAKPQPKVMLLYTEGPESDVTKALVPIEQAKEGVLIPRVVLDAVKAAIKPKSPQPFDKLWYVGGVASNPKKLQAVYFNVKAFAWQSMEWFKEEGLFPDADQVIPNRNNEAASFCASGKYLADIGTMAARIFPDSRNAAIRVITNHDRTELEQGTDACQPVVIERTGPSTHGTLTLKVVLMPVRPPKEDTYKRRSRPAMPAMAPESPQEPRSEPTPAQAPSGQLAGVLLDLVERTIAAYDGEGPTKDGLKDLATVIEEARRFVSSPAPDVLGLADQINAGGGL